MIRTTGELMSLYQSCRCSACAQRFTLVYRLAGYIRDDGIHEDADLDALVDVICVDTAQDEHPA